MKIGIVYPAEKANGIGIYAQQMADAFKAVANLYSIKVTSDTSLRGDETSFVVNFSKLNDYELAADWINKNCDVCILHHGFSCYGMPNSGIVMAMVVGLKVPMATIWHDVSHLATNPQRQLGESISQASNVNVVMSQQAANIIEHTFKVPAEKIRVLPFGTPSPLNIAKSDFKTKLGFGNRLVVMSIGLLRPDKGIDKILEAISILAVKNPDVLYCHLGVTDGNELNENDERYRQHLIVKSRNLKLQKNVRFINRFMSERELMAHLQGSDICLFGNNDFSQVHSQTMAMAMVAGSAIVSTRFAFANEMLGDKLGEITMFDDATVLAAKIQTLIDSPKQRDLYRQATGDFAHNFQWSKSIIKYLSLVKEFSNRVYERNRPIDYNLSQLLVSPATTLSAGQTTTYEATWALFNHAYTLECIGEDDKLLQEKAIATLLQVADNGVQAAVFPVLSERLGLGVTEQTALSAFALSSMLTRNSDDRMLVACNKFINKSLVDSGAEGLHQSILALTYCNLHELLPSDEKILAFLRKFNQSIADQLYSVNGSLVMWKEDEPFGLFPVVKALAALRAELVIGNPDDLSIAVKSAQYVVDKSFEEGCFLPLSNRKNGSAKIKRSETVQLAEEAVFTAMLCRDLAAFTNNTDYYSKAFQCYTWFLGENNLRKPLFDVKTGSCASMINGLEIDDATALHSTYVFGAALAMAYDTYVKWLATASIESNASF